MLILSDWFSPGYKAGGPIRSVVNLVRTIKKDFNIYILTSNRDLGGKKPYEKVPSNKWVQFDTNVKVYYLSEEEQNINRLLTLIKETKTNTIYLNSMFSQVFTIYPLLLTWRKKIDVKIILAPRGMLRSSAIKFKPFKKKLFLNILKNSRLIRKINFHATDETEKKDIIKWFGIKPKVSLIPNLAAPVEAWQERNYTLPRKLIFVGRIHPIKGLDLLLDALGHITIPIQLSILGAIEDQAYWQKCMGLINTLPGQTNVEYIGERPQHKVKEALLKNHIFVLPTHGENFGHAIFEALSSGLPVIISDQTPWRKLKSKRIGFDISIKDNKQLSNAIEALASMTQNSYQEWSKSAWRFAKTYSTKEENINAYKYLFSDKYSS